MYHFLIRKNILKDLKSIRTDLNIGLNKQINDIQKKVVKITAFVFYLKKHNKPVIKIQSSGDISC